MFVDPLFWPGMTFSAIALSIVGFSIWWLYLSPLKTSIKGAVEPNRQLAAWLAVLVLLVGFQMIGGAWWDASQHIFTGQVPGGADFLWPPLWSITYLGLRSVRRSPATG